MRMIQRLLLFALLFPALTMADDPQRNQTMPGDAADSGNAESWMYGSYRGLFQDQTPGSRNPLPNSFECYGGVFHGLNDDSDAEDSARDGVYRLAGDAIIFTFDDGSVARGEILLRSDDGTVAEFAYRGYLFIQPDLFPEPVPPVFPDPPGAHQESTGDAMTSSVNVLDGIFHLIEIIIPSGDRESENALQPPPASTQQISSHQAAPANDRHGRRQFGNTRSDKQATPPAGSRNNHQR